MSEHDGHELTGSSLDDDLTNVPIALTEAACDLLDIKPECRAELASALRRIVARYLSDRSLEDFYEAPGKARPALKRFLRSAGEAPLASFVAPEYVVTIEGLAEQLRRTAVTQKHPARNQPVAAFIRKAAKIFLEEYEPAKGRPTDLPLEVAVRSLIALLEQHTGNMPEVSLNKNNGRPPELRSPEAKAIGLLLRGVDPRLPELAIVNMIEKVKQRPRETEHFLHAIFRADPVAELDASLLTGREAAIERILADLL